MDMLKKWVRNPQVWGTFVSIIVMAVIAIAFFYPANVDGESLRQADMQQGAANGRESQLYYEETGQKALWTNSLFGGMPTFQISPTYESNALFDWLNDVYGLWLPAPSNLLFMMMLGFYILLLALRFRWYYGLIGAVAWAFSSYFIIIIGAGHIWKFLALTYIPPTIGGLVLLYRGRWVAGAAMLSLFAMLQLNANHPQMTYYFAFVMAALVIAWLVEAIRRHEMRRWWIATALTLGAGALALGSNLPSLYNTYEYQKETKRSQSELTPLPSADGQTAAQRPTGGMPYSDIVGWSYGQSETFSLLIPNVKGGASARPEKGGMAYMGLDRLEGASKYTNTSAEALLPYMSQYFNDSEGTNGPVYVGAVIFMLFLIGCFVVRGPVKWALLAVTVLSILLAWGRNFEALTDLMIYNFPLYNKFRAVESILVIAEFTMPLLALMGLREIFEADDAAERGRVRRAVWLGGGICAAVCLPAIIVPGVFGDPVTSNDRAQATEISRQVTQMARQYGYPENEVQSIAYQYSLSNPANLEAITDLRYGMVRADGWRSLLFVALATAFIMLYMTRSARRRVALAGVGLLVFIDLYSLDKRYVSHDSFVAVTADNPDFAPDAIDNSIMQDTTHYRVMDVPGFWRPDRSYYHSMVGGYHAAKLNRYEDLIQRILNPAVHLGYMPELREDSVIASLSPDEQAMAARLTAAYRVLDMLNARYIITGDASAPVVLNTHALGNAWLVGRLDYVTGADAEMAALSGIEPSLQAVADSRFKPVLGTVNGSVAPGDSITLISYTPNRLTYEATAATPLLGVFSEVWFPWGWKAMIDGQPAELGRVNYVLRALPIPAGRHEIVMTFDPDSLHITAGIAYTCVTMIYLLLLAALFVEYRRNVAGKTV